MPPTCARAVAAADAPAAGSARIGDARVPETQWSVAPPPFQDLEGIRPDGRARLIVERKSVRRSRPSGVAAPRRVAGVAHKKNDDDVLLRYTNLHSIDRPNFAPLLRPSPSRGTHTGYKGQYIFKPLRERASRGGSDCPWQAAHNLAW